MAQRIILHADMDAFFTSVEERENPELKRKAVVVGADPKGGTGRGVVSTCNYTARRFGIHSGMPISWAYRKCQDAVFLPVSMDLYIQASQKIMAILREYGTKFEQVSIDEAFVDLSSAQSFEKAKEIALTIKNKIKEKENLSCSVGIGPNKLIAKIASDFQKPDGLTIVLPEQVTSFLEPLKVRRLPGVGPKAEAALNSLNIGTIGQLAAIDISLLRKVFGNAWSNYLYSAARGNDEQPVEERHEIKSISRRVTFEKDTKDENILQRTLQELVAVVIDDLKSSGFISFKNVTLIIRYEDFTLHSKQRTLIEENSDPEVILKIVRTILKEFVRDSRKIRLIGITLSKLR